MSIAAAGAVLITAAVIGAEFDLMSFTANGTDAVGAGEYRLAIEHDSMFKAFNASVGRASEPGGVEARLGNAFDADPWNRAGASLWTETALRSGAQLGGGSGGN